MEYIKENKLNIELPDITLSREENIVDNINSFIKSLSLDEQKILDKLLRIMYWKGRDDMNEINYWPDA